jgi:pyrimidine-nucleoside phosphorylase
MSFVDVIAKKRDGYPLSSDEIEAFVRGVNAADVPDYQASALLMAIVWRGMSDQETAWLTDAMLRSGDRVNLADVLGPKVGKHSTGGVGDKVSIVLAPVVAACGIVLPKMSGRGLGHTGGTLDKLEAIPGFQVNLSVDAFVRMLADVGTSIVGQTASLVPADKALYALRDVTATVPSIPLIAASVMSKKLAEGSDGLVLDVKCGHGAFMKSEADARELARLMVWIGSQAGLRTEAVITNMDAPLGRAVGNALEVIECVETLKGRGPDDVTALGRVRQALIRREHAAKRWAVTADTNGYVAGLRADLVGRASMALGAGRRRIGDRIDYGAGVLVEKKPGESVRVGDTIMELLYNDDRHLEEASALARAAIQLTTEPIVPSPLMLGTVSQPVSR